MIPLQNFGPHQPKVTIGQHFLSITDLSAAKLITCLDYAQQFLVPDQHGWRFMATPLLKGKLITHLFFENSTRTQMSFTIAARYLAADVYPLAINLSSISKGESLLDTIHSLAAMSITGFIIRHPEGGILHNVAAQITNPRLHVINAGDGQNQHPTQALLDMYTIRHYKKDIAAQSVAIVGDLLHSRVARSDITALQLLGCQDIRLIAPKALQITPQAHHGIQVFEDLDQGLRDTDVVIVLRLQKERMSSDLIDEQAYVQRYGLTAARLRTAKPDAIVMHPGPMNRDVEISSEVADGPQSVILQQVNFAIAVRMAIMALLLQ